MRKCIYPQNILVVGNDGYTTSCPLEFNNAKLENINEKGLVGAWNSEKYSDFRNNLESYLTNPSKICWQCNKLEKSNAISLRTEFPILTEEPNLKGIQFKLSNRCQLVCAHCGPLLSSSWGKHIGKKDYVQDYTMSNEVVDELVSIVPSLNFIRFTGGEPWMDPMHKKILKKLDKVDKGNCELNYITNGLATVNYNLWKSWKHVKVMLSVDGYGKAYEWFRRGASWNKLVESYYKLKEISNVSVTINFSLTPWTINYLNDAKEFFKNDPMMVVPIMAPFHCSLGSIKKEDYKMLGLTKFKEYANIVGSNPKELSSLKSWAEGWDKKWNTVGYAKEIHPWLMKI
tara:strand:+ start:391 stop:1419 length:1029 start_codon:yes stop_codon:yes gene_type:complete